MNKIRITTKKTIEKNVREGYWEIMSDPIKSSIQDIYNIRHTATNTYITAIVKK